MKLYLAGPMSGIENHNYPAFHEAAAKLCELGHEVVSPAELQEFANELTAEENEKRYGHYLKTDLVSMMDCEGVVVLGEWYDSVGATTEVHVALALKLPIFYISIFEKTEIIVLSAAEMWDGVECHAAKKMLTGKLNGSDSNSRFATSS